MYRLTKHFWLVTVHRGNTHSHTTYEDPFSIGDLLSRCELDLSGAITFVQRDVPVFLVRLTFFLPFPPCRLLTPTVTHAMKVHPPDGRRASRTRDRGSAARYVSAGQTKYSPSTSTKVCGTSHGVRQTLQRRITLTRFSERLPLTILGSSAAKGRIQSDIIQHRLAKLERKNPGVGCGGCVFLRRSVWFSRWKITRGI